MKKQETQPWEIVIETITVIGLLSYIGLQIYYRHLYAGNLELTVILYHFFPVLLIYAGMLVLQMFPDLLNIGGSERLKGMVLRYAVRMVRNCKLLFVLGMLVPSLGDVLGVGMNEAYSLLLMAGILLNIGYYFYRIYEFNKKQK